MFCLADLCRALELKDIPSTSRKIDIEDKQLLPTLNSGGMQNITFVTESGMYTVILRSDSPLAKPMQKWVTSEVLPAIRKHGGYINERAFAEGLLTPDFLIEQLTKLNHSYNRFK